MLKFLKRNWITVIAALMVFVIGGYYFLADVKNVENADAVTEVRTVNLSNGQLDCQSAFENFDSYELKTVGTTTTFTGYQTLDVSSLQEIDNLSETDIENISNCQVFYEFSYDVESNIVTIYAYMSNELGELEMDKISGVGFINENDEIDAVMNIDGEGILLSEMRNAGMIQNCGWLSKLIKKVAVAVAVTAAVVAVAAVCVATCGAAAPALVGGAVAASGVVASTAAIATYATITAAVAAGVTLTAHLVEQFYPGVDAVDTTINGRKTVTAQWAKEKTKNAVRDLITAEVAKNKKPENQLVYFHVIKYNEFGPVIVDLTAYNYETMRTNMKAQGWSSLTGNPLNAQSVIEGAFNLPATLDNHNNRSLPHFHILLSNGDHLKAGPNGYIVHSYYCF